MFVEVKARNTSRFGSPKMAVTPAKQRKISMAALEYLKKSGMMESAAQRAGMRLEGPHPAFLVQGDDKLGTLARIHEILFKADVNIYASTGVTDGRGTFGYLIYVRPEEYERAAVALGI